MNWPERNPGLIASFQADESPNPTGRAEMFEEARPDSPAPAAPDESPPLAYDVHIGSKVTPDMLAPSDIIPDGYLRYLNKLIIPAREVTVVEDRLKGTVEYVAVLDIHTLGEAIKARAKHPSPRTEAGAWLQGVAVGIQKSSRMQVTVDLKISNGTTIRPRSGSDGNRTDEA